MPSLFPAAIRTTMLLSHPGIPQQADTAASPGSKVLLPLLLGTLQVWGGGGWPSALPTATAHPLESTAVRAQLTQLPADFQPAQQEPHSPSQAIPELLCCSARSLFWPLS